MTGTASAADFADNDVEAASLSLRWFRFAAGTTPEDDYRPVGSDGVGSKLLSELARICVAFHPHNGIRHFPKRRPALLFFRTESTGDYVVLRVGLRGGGPDGERLALEYDGLLLTTAELRTLGENPFTPGDLGLFDRVDRAAAAANGAPIAAAVAANGVHPARDARGDVDVEAFAPTSHRERLASKDEIDALEKFCRYEAARGMIPPTFATWWESGKALPTGYFDIVLRGPSPRGLTPHAVEQITGQLAADLAPVVEGVTLTGFQTRVEDTLRGCGGMTPPQYIAAMAAAADDLQAIGDRLEAEGGDAALVARCREFAEELRKLRHPDPFAAGRFGDAASPSAAARQQQPARYRKRLWILLALLAVALIALAIAKDYRTGPFRSSGTLTLSHTLRMPHSGKQKKSSK